MKIDNLICEAYYERDQEAEEKSNAIIDWAKNNLKSFYSGDFEFEIDENFVIHTPKAILTQPITTFPYSITDCHLVSVLDVDVLESFDNFPTPGNSDSFKIEFNGYNNTHIDFSKLPEYTSADFLEIIFNRVSNVTTKNLQHVHYNIDTLTLLSCESPDLYDFEKYVLYVSDCVISPTRRFKNLSSFLRKEIVYESFKIDNIIKWRVYSYNEAKDLNMIFAKYNREYESIMDFTLELIESGFEDEV